jgi:integrase
MCLTGMGPKEYWVDGWSIESDRVRIRGKKALGRVREVPLVDMPVRPEITKDGFTSALRRLSKERLMQQLTEQLEREPTADELAAAIEADPRGVWKVTPYQARKTFARWMEDARIPRARREIYRGHGKRDIGDIYERYEVAAYLREDAQAMRALLGPQKLALAR